MIGRAAAVTDPGRMRRHNEDAYVIEPPLFAIADGMGGARAGEIAAGIAAAALKDSRSSVTDEDSLEAVIDEANRRVWERSVADPGTSGMGTTVTAAYVDAAQDRVIFGQVGDSRAYRLRGETLVQVTTDHSLVAELVRSGVLTPEEAERHPQRSAITRAVGTESDIEADVFAVPAELEDLYLLCSDGLTGLVSDDQIHEVVTTLDDLEAACSALIQRANFFGGSDNITVVVAKIEGGDDPLEATQPVPTATRTIAEESTDEGKIEKKPADEKPEDKKPDDEKKG